MVICDSSPPPHFTLLASSAIQLHCTQRFPLHLVNHRVLFSYTDCYGYNSDYRSGNVVARIKNRDSIQSRRWRNWMARRRKWWGENVYKYMNWDTKVLVAFPGLLSSFYGNSSWFVGGEERPVDEPSEAVLATNRPSQVINCLVLHRKWNTDGWLLGHYIYRSIRKRTVPGEDKKMKMMTLRLLGWLIHGTIIVSIDYNMCTGTDNNCHN